MKRTKLFWELNSNNRFCLLPEIACSTCLLTCYPEERTRPQSPSHPTLTLPVNPREVFTAMFLALVRSGWPKPGYTFKSGTRWGPLGNKRRTPQVSGPWAFRGTARFAKQALTTWKYRQVLRKTAEEKQTPPPRPRVSSTSTKERLVLAEVKQSQFCRWHVQLQADLGADECFSVLTGRL